MVKILDDMKSILTDDKVQAGMDSAQRNKESGGRQNDAQGNPLVGHYRDGTMPEASKRAYGVSQMQIGTARNVAKAHGIQWDEAKFLHDKAYNAALGDNHMDDLRKTYNGNERLAQAAYHSGEPIVNRAVAKYGQANFTQGLGPEGRNYVAQVGGGNKAGPGNGVANVGTLLDSFQSALGPEGTDNSNVRVDDKNIQSAAPRIDAAQKGVDQQLTASGGTLDVLAQVTQVAHAVQTQAAGEKVAETRAISQEITDGTNKLVQQTTPIFQRRTRIADQLDKISGMNPLLRGIKGVFDLDYDKSYLEGQLDSTDRTLDARAKDFDYVNKLHESALGEIDRRYGIATALPDLAVEQTKGDFAIAGQRLSQASVGLSNELGKISSDSTLMAAKKQASNTLLDGLGLPTIAGLLTQADKNGGVITFNDTQLTSGQLREAGKGREQQDLQIEAYHAAITSSRIDSANKFAANITDSMTRPQLEEALANGGMWKGVQLNIPQLQGNLQQSMQTDSAQANAIAASSPAGSVFGEVTQTTNAMVGTYTRSKGVFGKSGSGQASIYLQEAADTTNQIVEAVNRGDAPEKILALRVKLQNSSQNFDKLLKTQILAANGGDQVSAEATYGFMTGAPLDAASSISIIAHSATRGALPAGMDASPEAKEVFRLAQKIGDDYKKDPANAKRLSPKQVEEHIARELPGQAQAIVGQARGDRLYQELPRLAQQIGSAFSQIKQEDWSGANRRASAAAATAVAHTIGTTPQDVLIMARTGKATGTTPEKIAIFKKFQENQDNYNGVEQASLIQELDDLPQIQAGRRNSTLLQDVLTSPQLSRTLDGYDAQLGASSAGDYFVNPLVTGAVSSSFREIAGHSADAQAQATRAQRQGARDKVAAYSAVAGLRPHIILSGIPGVGRDGADALMRAIPQPAPTMGDAVDQGLSNIGISGPSRAKDNAFFHALQAAKFDDPSLEAYRKTAVKGWSEVADQRDSVMDDVYRAFQPDGIVSGLLGKLNPGIDVVNQVRQVGNK